MIVSTMARLCRFAGRFLFAACAVFASLPAQATALSYEADFSGSGLPIWNPSDADPIFDEVLAEVPVGPAIGVNTIADFGVFGEWGFAANFRAGVDIGLATKVSDFHIGSTDIAYPVKIDLDIPDQIKAGESFTISSSYSVLSGAGFTAVADSGVLDIGARAGLEAQLSLKACAFGCFIDEMPVDVSQPLGTLPLLRQTKTATELQIDIPGYGKPTISGSGIDIDPDNTDDSRGPTDPDFLFDLAVAEVTNISGKVQSPDLAVTGELSGSKLTGSATDVFTNIDVNLTGFIPGATLANFGPIDLGNGLQFGYDLFSGVLETSLVGRQDMTFEAIPEIELDFGVLGVHSFKAGESITLHAPADLADLTIEPTFRLPNTFTNELILAAAQDFIVTVGGLFLSLPDTELIPATDPVIIDPPSFCLIPNPFGGCITRVNPPPFTLIPGTPGLTVPGFTFDEQILQLSFQDELIKNFGGLSVDTCDVGSVCDTLPLFGANGAKKSSLFVSEQSFDFTPFSGQAFSLNVITADSAVPVPSTILLLMSALLLMRRSGYAAGPRLAA